MDSFFLRVLSQDPLSLEVLGSRGVEDRLKLKHRLEVFFPTGIKVEGLRHQSNLESELLHLASREVFQMFQYSEVQVSLQVGLVSYTIIFRRDLSTQESKKSRFDREVLP